jgi:hypothetical protein
MAETLGMRSFAAAGGPSGLTERTKTLRKSAEEGRKTSEVSGTPETIEQVPTSKIANKHAGTGTTIYSVPSRLMPTHDPVLEVDANLKARRDELERSLFENKKLREERNR